MPLDVTGRPKRKTRAKKTAPVVWTPEDSAAAWAWAGQALRDGIRPELTRVSLVDWAEQHRVIPQGLSSRPGRFSWSVTPYLEEIAENLSETSPVQYVAVLKAAQVGFSVGVGENWILYTIDQAPGPMLYVGQTQQAVEKIMAERISPAIHESGLDHKIFAQAKSRGSRKTGNTDESKQFPGGRLHAIGPNMGSRIRSDSFQKGYLDELDAWSQEIGSAEGKRKSEGSTLVTIEHRFDTFENTKKLLYGSTPLEASSSLIEPMFEKGDQRKFHVPCKHCGELQPVEWERLKYEANERGVLIPESVHYECAFCGGHWKNEDKVEFLKTERQGGRAKWIPTAEPTRAGMRSYHIPVLISNFRSWQDVCRESIEAGRDPTKLQDFWNLALGRSWQPTGAAPDYIRQMLKREPLEQEAGNLNWYDPNVWPDRALICTIGADVQKDRIEAEVVAWGYGLESWSLGYYVFKGDTSSLDSPAWGELRSLIYSEPSGHQVNACLIDSSYESHTVYAFCDQFVGVGVVLPCMGESMQNAQRRSYALTKMSGYAQRRADLQTDQFKAAFYAYSRGTIPEGGGLIPSGYCHFPTSYGEKHFKQLYSEEKVPERQKNGTTRYKWKIIKDRGQRNEQLDCRVYAMAALHVFKDLVMGEAEEPAPWGAFWSWAMGESIP